LHSKTSKLGILNGISILILLISLSSSFSTAIQNENINTPQLSQNNILVRSHTIEIDIFTPTTLEVQETFVIQNNHTSIMTSIDLWINHSLTTLVVEDEEGALIHDWYVITNTSNLLTVLFRTALSQNDTAVFTINYELNQDLLFTEGEPSYYSLDFYSTITYETLIHSTSIILPQTSYIYDENEALSPYYPADPQINWDKDRIVVSWSSVNLTAGDNQFYLLRFEEPITPAGDAPISPYLIFLLGAIAGIFVGISGVSWLIRHREKKAIKKLGSTLLTDTQKTLIKIVYDHEGKVSQKDLCDITGFSKSKISRNLVPLEMRGLIRREQWGRTYVVYLTDDGRTVIE